MLCERGETENEVDFFALQACRQGRKGMNCLIKWLDDYKELGLCYRTRTFHVADFICQEGRISSLRPNCKLICDCVMN